MKFTSKNRCTWFDNSSKKQPLPVVESVEEEDDPGVAVENAPSSSEDEDNTVEESDEKAGLRERVKNALNELER